MGLSNESGSVTYVNMKAGKLATKQSDGTIKLFESITGYLTAIDIIEDEYNGDKFEKLSLTMEDNEGRYLVRMRLESGYARGFLFAIKNADLSQELTIIPNSKEVNGKPQTTVFLKQGNASLKWVWTKDNPGDLPRLSQVTVKGKTIWDNTEQLEYFKNMLTNDIIPALGKAPAKVELLNGKSLVAEHDDLDSLPF
jgi:hypothetical protein